MVLLNNYPEYNEGIQYLLSKGVIKIENSDEIEILDREKLEAMYFPVKYAEEDRIKRNIQKLFFYG